MAKIGVELKIDVTKINKAKLYKGEKGTYLTCTAFIDVDQKDEYDNNGMIVQKVSKEEQEQGIKGAILGNSKVFWSDGGQPQQPQQQGHRQPPQDYQPQMGRNPNQPTGSAFDDSSNIPFAPLTWLD